ncbi:hypothetical protein FB382_001305 [Nocardioides ginsengisegetis]|uniref:Uncharacterized protein n=1 Tax=Nocardioides ginsengisegetis TaxID=661491 RepID=A0A7W3IYQ5_9ACTN|nr:hypothetical protein [Nocardioides ginsengisegetis]MBA8803014.1 hypothetical protein [Nocardioides ginsengisegetis]
MASSQERSSAYGVLSDWGLWLGVVDLLLLIFAWATHSLTLLTVAIALGLLTLVAQISTKLAAAFRGHRQAGR